MSLMNHGDGTSLLQSCENLPGCENENGKLQIKQIIKSVKDALYWMLCETLGNSMGCRRAETVRNSLSC